MANLNDHLGTAARRRHRHRRRHLARRRQGRQLGSADCPARPASTRSPAFRSIICNTRIAGTVDFLPSSTKGASALLTYELAELAARGSRGRGRSSIRAISAARFSSPRRRSNSNGSDRFALYDSGQARRRRRYGCSRVAARPEGSTCSTPTQFGAIADRLADKFRHARPADHAVDGLRFGRDRHPARRRGDPPRRKRPGAVDRRRWLGDRRGADPLFAALGAFHP